MFDDEYINDLESRLESVVLRAKELSDSIKLGSAGATDAFYLHSDAVKALAHLRLLKKILFCQ